MDKEESRFGMAYLDAVRRHWVALVTGSLPIAIYAFLIAAYPDVDGARHLWNHLPQWVVWTFAFLAAVLAQFLTWRDAVIERDKLRKVHPRLSGYFYKAPGRRLMLGIVNEGASAEIWARIKIKGNYLTKKPHTDAYATWNHTSEPRCKIAPKETLNIVVAEPSHEGVRCYWYVPFIENGKLDKARSQHTSMVTRPNPLARIDISIEVFSDPDSLSQPIRFGLTLKGCDEWENLTGVLARFLAPED